jgi:cytochrome c-type biogenesis protein
MFDVSFFSALLGGILTFLAPCTLPLIPAYIGFLGGSSSSGSTQLGNKVALRRRIYWNALLFVLGFSLIFIIFGLVSGTLGKFLILHRAVISSLGGILVIGFGLIMLGYVPFPNLFARVGLPHWLHPGKPFSAFLLGLLFALGWSPCLGPILGTILLLAGSSGTALYGGYLLAVYSLGLAIPFLFVAFLYGSAFTYIAPLARYLPLIEKCAGVFLIIIGVLLLIGDFGLLNVWFTDALSWDWYERLMDFM